MGHRHLKKTCLINSKGKILLEQAFTRMNLSARSYDRIIKVARTIADLADCEEIVEQHIAEAIQLRGNYSTI